MKALFIGLVWPESRSTAASQNILSYLHLFQQQGVECLFVSAAQKTEKSDALDTIGIASQSIALNCASFDHLVAEFAPDIVVFDRFLSEEQFAARVMQAAPQALRILDCEDLHFLRQARASAYRQGQDLNQQDVSFSQLSNDTAIREIAAIYRCDLSIVLSSKEQDILSKDFGISTDLIACVPFLYRPELAEHEMQNTFQQRVDFISIGSFRHAPNWDAVLKLKQGLWPSIRKQLPNANCHVYGSYLTPKAKALEDKKTGFLVHGFVENAPRAMSNSRVLLAPIQFGAGLKGKLLDAIYAGTPSVTSSIGAEGYPFAADWPGAIANNDADFIKAAVRLYKHEADWQAAHKTTLNCHLSTNQLAQLGQQLWQRVSAVQSTLSEHRSKNFLGRMMQHQSLYASKYMSQWIEAKNRPSLAE